MPELQQASYQWFTRPDDERFETLKDLYLHCWVEANRAKTRDISIGELKVVAEEGDLKLQSPAGVLGFNNWSFSQFARTVGAPAGYLHSLTAKTAAINLNENISSHSGDSAQLYYDGTTLVNRAITSQKYGRLPNHEVVKKVMDLGGNWRTPPARPAFAGQKGTRIATEEDCKCATLIKPGDLINPRTLYGSDRNVFIFMVDPSKRIEDGSDGGLSRGFMVSNSEVGDAQICITTFWYRYTCGNHIIWGAENVHTFSTKHIGKGVQKRAFDRMDDMLKDYAEKSTDDDNSMITRAKNKELAPNYEGVLDLIFQNRKLMAKNKVELSWSLAEAHPEDGAPTSVWGLTNGVTRLSQRSPYADERKELDLAACAVLALAD